MSGLSTVREHYASLRQSMDELSERAEVHPEAYRGLAQALDAAGREAELLIQRIDDGAAREAMGDES